MEQGYEMPAISGSTGSPVLTAADIDPVQRVIDFCALNGYRLGRAEAQRIYDRNNLLLEMNPKYRW
jgi:hypothetical protein